MNKGVFSIFPLVYIALTISAIQNDYDLALPVIKRSEVYHQWLLDNVYIALYIRCIYQT